jgi:transposase-like protein
MKTETKSKQTRTQDANQSSGEIFREYLRGVVQTALGEVMQEEVEGLCGPKYQPVESAVYRRAGSDDGVVYYAGRKEAIKRPRVRMRGAEREQEVRLKSYEQARQQNNITAEVMALVEEGLSARSCQRVTAGAMSSSVVSRQWAVRSAEHLEALRSRDLTLEKYFGLMIDGVFLSEDLVVVVAMGIKEDGGKQMLDFVVGSTESYEVVRELLVRLRERRFGVSGRLLAILDGAKALHKAVVEFWPDAVIQGCLVHKERNLHGYLRWRDHGECSRLMKRIRQAQGEAAGQEALAALRKFLAERNAAAVTSLDEAGESLIALHSLNVPATLNVSLLSTNLIENVMRNYRRQTDRVSRWNPKSNQVERWTSTALLWVERGFRKIKGHEHLPILLNALRGQSANAAPAPISPHGGGKGNDNNNNGNNNNNENGGALDKKVQAA